MCDFAVTSQIQMRKPLSFHAVSFRNPQLDGTLQRMTHPTLEIQNNVHQDYLLPGTTTTNGYRCSSGRSLYCESVVNSLGAGSVGRPRG
ncbi:hypothetical protein BJV77DRAFT_452519 [Russula vinacea]|nr:hypothetical protein BJV77DRAFT_452519 [Russula vinacea]